MSWWRYQWEMWRRVFQCLMTYHYPAYSHGKKFYCWNCLYLHVGFKAGIQPGLRNLVGHLGSFDGFYQNSQEEKKA